MTGGSSGTLQRAFAVFLVLLGPLVEELYFRGYLLPRIGRFGAWAPLINVSLFALYHLWKPWDAINLIIVLAPMVYAVWRLRDVRISIAVNEEDNVTPARRATERSDRVPHLAVDPSISDRAQAADQNSPSQPAP